ncbi:hypothetical protein BU26DRAFT_505073 [Trematosphaeria pertusa]|uniref:SRR1-like domain-containing protein n=1 Tax=Trematosphaeria pertusa TaxID=390896 RepID=A0A6A6IFI9_9PLEO|nr:uncharacterized protein BU26DRAFT_505073 [Trematosphaeria pertusa]KAF2248957.1 hypothetical protein BU26DRAFT_505073 [Trematosphaeria pertusa]
MSKRERSSPSPQPEPKQRTTESNITGAYLWANKYGDPPGTIWSRETIAEASKLQASAHMWNDMRRLRPLANALPVIKDKFTAEEIPHLQQMTKDIEEEIERLNRLLGDFSEGGIYRVRDIFGEWHTFPFPEVRPRHKLIVRVLGVVAFSQNFDDNNDIKTDNPKQKCLYDLEPMPLSKHDLWRQCDTYETPPWEFWMHEWETGNFHLKRYVWRRNIQKPIGIDFVHEWRHIRELSADQRKDAKHWASHWKMLADRLRSYIKEHRERLKNVDKVICFALGPLHYGFSKCFVQHMAANTVREVLEELKKTKRTQKNIGVVAQDPAYCKHCAHVLQETLSIETTTDFEAFLEVGQNTFVITFAPSAPVCGIIADLTLEVGGPAAMLCDEIEDDYLRPEWDDTRWIDAEPTKNLVAYKRRCSIKEFGDTKDVMGMSYHEFMARYPIVPAELPHDTPNETEIWEEVKKVYSLSFKSNFHDIFLYVRKKSVAPTGSS